MVIGEEASAVQAPAPQPPANIDNIMSGIGNTGSVRMNNHRKKLRQRFDIIKKLGQGTYGKVQLGINKETGQEVAIKTIKKCKIETEADLIRIRREVQIMSSVQHPNIIHIYEVFENREKMVLVMEFAAGGELYDYLSERKVLAEEEARRVFRQISTAVYYCHKHKICHRDLKLENILLDEHGSAKIADFGLSNVFDDTRLLATFCGSPLYASPEIVKGTPYQGPEVDCWSLGVLLYTLVYGAMPFDGSNFKRLVKQISQGDYYEPQKASPASPLIREMLTVCPKRRATIETICSHWWVNEGYDESCLDLAEELANKTPVRLDVLLSLAPPAVTSEQLVVPSGVQESKSSDRVPRSYSVGSVVDLANTEAEQRIIDMVAAGGEAALMPSPTRIITPAESPAQPKRKLETTISTENATGAIKKKPIDDVAVSKQSIAESMEIDEQKSSPSTTPDDSSPVATGQQKELDNIENICDELLEDEKPSVTQKTTPTKRVVKKKVISPEKVSQKKVVEEPIKTPLAPTPVTDEPILEREEPSVDDRSKSSEETITSNKVVKPAEKRRSKIFETAEKFQNMNAQNTEKAKKFGAAGLSSVGNFKKEFERKASLTGSNLANENITPEKKILGQGIKINRKSSLDETRIAPIAEKLVNREGGEVERNSKLNDSKSSIANFSLEEARRSMENSIALLNQEQFQAKNESSKEVDQLCAKTENVSVSDIEREKKLRNAREIIGNAIQPNRLCMGVRKPPVPFGINGRSISGSVIPSNTGFDKKSLRVQVGPDPSDMANATYSVSTPENRLYPQDPMEMHRPIAVATLDETPELEHDAQTKTSRAEITLKSATLPRRKPAKTEVKLEIETKQEPRGGMRFSTEMAHHVPDLRSAPIREGPIPYSPISPQVRANSLEPQAKEVIIPIARPPTYQKTPTVGTGFRAGSLSRQSTNDSDTDTTTTQPPTSSMASSSTLAGGASSTSSNAQPIKKSPREFIIPIAVEGGGFVTPRAGSLEPSESSTTTSTNFSKLGRPRRMGSLLSDKDADEDSPFNRINRHTSIGRDSDNDEPRFHTMHRLRSTRPLKRVVNQDPNDSASSGDDDDEDGFEILTAENLFSTLLQRVRALTNRLNVNDTPSFPSTRLMGNMRQQMGNSPFWHHDPFGSNLNKSSSSWRHSISRDLGSDIDSMFSRSGATLPRGTKFKSTSSAAPTNLPTSSTATSSSSATAANKTPQTNQTSSSDNNEKLDLRDLDLSRLRLTKKDLETLSTLTPTLPKEVQEQLIAQLPPNQARKLCRTLSMQNNPTDTTSTAGVKPYKRSLSGGREVSALGASSRDRESSVGLLGKPSETTIDRNSIYRRSLSKNRYDVVEKHSRSSSRCRDSVGDTDDSTKSFLSDVTKYRADSQSQSSSTLSPTQDGLPPIPGCVSPPPLPGDVTLRRRSTPKRISRFLRPDFFDTPREESIYVSKDNINRDAESRKILHEIRERSRERSLDRRGSSSDRLNYYIDKYSASGGRNETDGVKSYSRHSSVDGFSSSRDNILEFERQMRRSLSKSKDNSLSHIPQSSSTVLREENSNFADAIINELQAISSHQKSADEPNISRTKSREVIVEEKRKSEEREKSVEKKNEKVYDLKMVTNMTKEIDSISPLNVIKTRESRIARPKSYPSKNVNRKLDDSENDRSEASQSNSEPVTEPIETVTVTVRCARPKSFPNSKLTPPKDIKKEDDCVKEKEKVVKTDKSTSKVGQLKPNGEPETKKTVKKVIKTVKKTIKKPVAATADNVGEIKDKSASPEENNGTKKPVVKLKEASPEKKVSKGLFYTIGQKFEKFRENSKASKEKKIEKQPSPPPATTQSAATISSITPTSTTETSNDSVKPVKLEKKSKIDTVIRNLREKSVPKSPQMTESRLLKRAVSVEDISGSPSKYGVNKVLGLFKKYENQSQDSSKIKSTKSTSNVENTLNYRLLERPKTTIGPPITTRKVNQYRGAKSDTTFTITNEQGAKSGNSIHTKIPKFNCSECNDVSMTVTLPMPPSSSDSVTKRHSTNEAQLTSNDRKEELKNKRKGLLLDLSKVEAERTTNNNNNSSVVNGNGMASNHLNNNNNHYAMGSTTNHSGHDINRNKEVAEDQYDNLINYSSDLRSPYDDTASTSTIFSPTDEPELYFDNWSVCSDDHTRPHTSPAVNRYSSNASHYLSSPPPAPNDNESIVDRIRRKSFYTRFNEKKPKRVSTIVGPSANKDFYREPSVTRTARPPTEYKQRAVTTSLDQPRTTHEYYRPIKVGAAYENSYNLNGSMTKLAPSSSYDKLNGDKVKLPTNSYNHSHHHHHHHHHHPLPPTSTSSVTSKLLHHNASDGADYSSYRSHLPPTPSTSKRPTSSIYENSFPSTYSSSTYNPRLSGSSLAMLAGRTSPYSNGLSGSSSSGVSNLETYGTLGRKIRPYEQRSVSLLNAPAGLATSKPYKLGGGGAGSSSSSSNGGIGRDSLLFNRDQRLSTDFGSISRSNIRLRTPTSTKTPST